MANRKSARPAKWATSPGLRRRMPAAEPIKDVRQRRQLGNLLVDLGLEFLKLHHVLDPRIEEFESVLLVLAPVGEPAKQRGRIDAHQNRPLGVEVEIGGG